LMDSASLIGLRGRNFLTIEFEVASCLKTGLR
jgi:hypothetical protein